MVNGTDFSQFDLSIKGEAAGDPGQDAWINKTGCPLEIQSVTLNPQATAATNGTNYSTLTASVDGTSIGTRDTSATSLTQNSEENMTITAGVVIPVDGEFKLAKTVAASGVAINTRAYVKVRPIRSAS